MYKEIIQSAELAESEQTGVCSETYDSILKTAVDRVSEYNSLEKESFMGTLLHRALLTDRIGKEEPAL